MNFIIFSILILSVFVVIYSQNTQGLCGGYIQDGKCYSIGDELRIDGQYYYVDENGNTQPQKQDGAYCQNSFECLNNLCSNNECVNKFKEAQKNTESVKEAQEKSGEIQLEYDVSISIQTTKDRYLVGEKIELE